MVEKLPRNEYTEDAMLAIESIYQSMGEPESFLAYSESVGDGSRKTDAEKEQIYFNSAEQVFLSGNYQKALTSLQKYFDAYPSGTRATEAYFYQAECYNALGQKEGDSDPTVTEMMRRIKSLVRDDQYRTAIGMAKKLKKQIDDGQHIASDEDYDVIGRMVAYAG